MAGKSLLHVNFHLTSGPIDHSYCLKLHGGALFPFYSGLSPVKINDMHVQTPNLMCGNGLHAHFKAVASSLHCVGLPFTSYCFVLVRIRPFCLLFAAYIAILKRPICSTIPGALYASGKALSAIYSSQLVLVGLYLLPPRGILTGGGVLCCTLYAIL